MRIFSKDLAPFDLRALIYAQYTSALRFWERFREANQFIREFVDSSGDFAVPNGTISKCRPCRVNEARYDDASEVEHQAVCHAHHRHVAGVASRRVQKSNRLPLPCAACQLHEVFDGSVHVEIINGRRDKNSCGLFDSGAYSFNFGIRIGSVSVAHWELHLLKIDKINSRPKGIQGVGGMLGHLAAQTFRIQAPAYQGNSNCVLHEEIFRRFFGGQLKFFLSFSSIFAARDLRPSGERVSLVIVIYFAGLTMIV